MRVPEYVGSEIQKDIAKKSRLCHTAAKKEKSDELATLEAEIDELVAAVWGLSKGELKAVQKTVSEMERRGNSAEDDDTERE